MTYEMKLYITITVLSLLLMISLIVNGIQGGKIRIDRQLIIRTKNALEFTLAKEKALNAKKAIIEYKIMKEKNNKKIDENNKELNKLKENLRKKESKLKNIKDKIGKMNLEEVVKELAKELGEHAMERIEKE